MLSLIVFEQWVSKTTDDKSAGLVLNWFLPNAVHVITAFQPHAKRYLHCSGEHVSTGRGNLKHAFLNVSLTHQMSGRINKGKARVATARKRGIRLWIMMRDQIDYEEFCRRGKLRQTAETHAGMPDFHSVVLRVDAGSGITT